MKSGTISLLLVGRSGKGIDDTHLAVEASPLLFKLEATLGRDVGVYMCAYR